MCGASQCESNCSFGRMERCRWSSVASSRSEPAMASEPMAHVAHVASMPVNVFALPEFSSDIVRCIDSLIRDVAAVMTRREAQLQYWKSRAHALEPARREWRARLPADRQATLGKLHFSLIQEMLAASGRADNSFSLHLEQEMSCSRTDRCWLGWHPRPLWPPCTW